MDWGNLLKIDYWWKLVLLCGILLSGSSMIFDIQFIERRYVLGLGIGMTLIGIGYWMAKKVAHQWADGGMYQWDIFEHNWITKSTIGVGILISIYFFIRILILLAL
ncbi:hypothetical protein [Parabacteroides distasonis]|jgi:hypothetical protein|uniref:Uncharacterized protein n=1 Tax=Parabacteroides distasonis TaxID=823 RepID=A0A5C6KNU0_PARDI|nr:hypothetical protein [Parabacteroides distasonis]TWV64056.1 hypothetical protein FSA05_00075 [Parabacteroides distasonis]